MKKNSSINLFRALFSLGAFLAGSGVALAQYETADHEVTALKHSDRSFLEKAVKSGLDEVAISQVVAERSSNPRIREFAQMIVGEHTSTNNTLTQLAATKKVALPPAEQAPSKWSKSGDKDFDEDYVEKMISEHESAVKLFTKEANDGKDQELVVFARSTLPTLQHHLEQAKDLKKMLKS